MLTLAVVGLWCASRLPKLSPKNPDMKIRFGFYGFFGINIDMIRQAAGTPLLAVTGAFSVFFIIFKFTFIHFISIFIIIKNSFKTF